MLLVTNPHPMIIMVPGPITLATQFKKSNAIDCDLFELHSTMRGQDCGAHHATSTPTPGTIRIEAGHHLL